MAIFVDTSFWLALRNRRDAWHGEASRLWDPRLDALTSNHVVGETWTFLRRRLGHDVAIDFIDRVERAPRLTVRSIDDELEDEAWRWLRRHDERPYSFVDATSFALMRRERIRRALAFDGDFAAAGFTELRP